MRSSLLVLPLVMLLLTPLARVASCPPTGGYVGAIYRQATTEQEILDYLRRSGVADKFRVGIFSFSPYYPSYKRLRAVFIEIGRFSNRIPLRAYVIPGRNYTLLLVETTSKLDFSSLKFAESLLSGLLNPKNIVKESGSQNNYVPPTPIADWEYTEKGVRVKINVLRCSSSPASFVRLEVNKVAVIANEIDANLSLGVVRDALKERGIPVDYLGWRMEALPEAINYRVVIFLGGQLAPETGKFVIPILGNLSSSLSNSRRWLIYSTTWGMGSLVVVIAGSDRYMTKKAAERFASSDILDEVVKAVKEGGAVGVESLTWSSGSGNWSEKVSVFLNSTSGGCGFLEGADLSLRAEGDRVIAVYRQGASNPCAQFYLKGYRISERFVTIELGVVSTSEFCVECLGVLTAKMTIGPLSPGTYRICVDEACGIINLTYD